MELRGGKICFIPSEKTREEGGQRSNKSRSEWNTQKQSRDEDERGNRRSRKKEVWQVKTVARSDHWSKRREKNKQNIKSSALGLRKTKTASVARLHELPVVWRIGQPRFCSGRTDRGAHPGILQQKQGGENPLGRTLLTWENKVA